MKAENEKPSQDLAESQDDSKEIDELKKQVKLLQGRVDIMSSEIADLHSFFTLHKLQINSLQDRAN